MACFLSHLPVTPCSGREAGDSALVCLGKSFPPAAPEAVTSIPRLRYKCRGRDHNPGLPALLCVFHFRLAVFLDVKHTSDL